MRTILNLRSMYSVARTVHRSARRHISDLTQSVSDFVIVFCSLFLNAKQWLRCRLPHHFACTGRSVATFG